AAQPQAPAAATPSVRWSQRFHQPGAIDGRLVLTIDLKAGQELLLKDPTGAVHCRYSGRGPGAVAAAASSVDAGAANGGWTSFVSHRIPGDTILAEVRGGSADTASVTVRQALWSDPASGGGTLAASSGGTCSLGHVLPAGSRATEGAASTGFPFNTPNSMRVMYSYDGAAASIGERVRICGLRFRPNENIPSINAFDLTFRLDVSTGRNPALSLAQVFADNHGADVQTVFDGTLTQSAVSGIGTSPNSFVLEIPFSTPFEWDPSFGPLLLDFQHQGAVGGNAVWDATVGVPGGGRIAATGQGANASTSTFPGNGQTQNVSMPVELCLEADVVPIAVETTEANSSSSYPFGRTTPMRVQYLYGASTFGFDGRHRISALNFRTQNGVAFPGNSYDLLVTMSSTASPASATSSTFANNHGSDETVVFDGVVNAEPRDASASAPGPFVLTIPLDEPFEYNPANGQLVVDFQLRTGASNSLSFDGDFNNSDVYRLYSVSSSTATSGTVQNFGLAMALTAEPMPTIPESSDAAFASSTTSYPWNQQSLRAMYRYDASRIATDRPLYLQHLSFRPSNSAQSYGSASYTCTIDLSTGINPSPTPLNVVFDANHGTDRARAFDGVFTVPFQEGSAPADSYPITVQLDEPFFYDPANGPLVVDIRMLDIVGDTRLSSGGFGTGLDRIAHRSDPNAFAADFGPQGFALDIRLGGAGCNATSVPYGTACAGTFGTPQSVNVGLPTLPANDFGLRVLNGVPNGAAFLILALTQTNVPLGVIGAPGCTGLTGGEIGALTTFLDASGSGTQMIALPDNPIFNGFQFMTQWIVLDLPANQLGLIYSNAQLHTTCY
ncbi:MAG: hypothetical protein AB8H80_19410, partial [Planctomycetota bacterium]